jgi:hypothetical protein
VLVYGYVTNIYSSRKLAAACKESVYLMWLSSMSYPDHNTINRFRGVRLKHALRSVFEDVVKLLSEEGLLSIDEVNTDGTKIEASANKYTFVWKKSIQTNKEKMKKQLTEIWQYAQQVAADEDQMPEPPDFTEIDSEKVKATVEKLNEKLAGRDDIGLFNGGTKGAARFLRRLVAGLFYTRLRVSDFQHTARGIADVADSFYRWAPLVPHRYAAQSGRVYRAAFKKPFAF